MNREIGHETQPGLMSHLRLLNREGAYEAERDRRIAAIEKQPLVPDDMYEAANRLTWEESAHDCAVLTGLVNAKDADGLLAMVERLLSERRTVRAENAVNDQMSEEAEQEAHGAPGE